MSALSTNSIYLAKLTSGEYKSTPLPTDPQLSSEIFFEDFFPLSSRDIVKDYESKSERTNKLDKKVTRLYKRALRRHAKLEARISNMMTRKDEGDFNGEYLWMQLQIKEVEILKLEKYFEIKGLYCEIIELVKEIEDPYKLDKEKIPFQDKLKVEFEEFYDLLRQLRYLDVERHKLLKMEKRLKRQGVVWYKKIIEKIL